MCGGGELHGKLELDDNYFVVNFFFLKFVVSSCICTIHELCEVPVNCTALCMVKMLVQREGKGIFPESRDLRLDVAWWFFTGCLLLCSLGFSHAGRVSAALRKCSGPCPMAGR